MAQKLWEKSVQVNKDIERFTVGRDRVMDLYLAKHDVLGSMAHITMLESIGLLTKEELEQLLAELKTIYASVERGEFFKPVFFCAAGFGFRCCPRRGKIFDRGVSFTDSPVPCSAKYKYEK